MRHQSFGAGQPPADFKLVLQSKPDAFSSFFFVPGDFARELS